MAEYDKKWPMPRYTRLDHEVKAGQELIVKAKVHDLKDIPEKDKPNIVMDLVGDSGKTGSNIPLHVRIYFRQKVILLNSKINGGWGKDEQHEVAFQLNEAMNLKVRMENDHFVLLADDKEFAKYNYRVPLSTIKQFEINGPIDLYGVQWTGNHYNVPFETAVDKFGVGTRVFISGMPVKDTTFCVNLKTEDGQYVFHIRPYMQMKVIVRNSSTTAVGWCKEEYDLENGFPFSKDVRFDLVIVNKENFFQVFVNENPLCTFAHRMDSSLIKKVQIEGDVELYNCAIF